MPRQTLTIALGFDGALELLYPNEKGIILPKGEAEARIVEILEGFRRDYKTIKKERSKESVVPTLSLEDLGL